MLNCFGKPDKSVELVKGPNIKDIPVIPGLKEDLLLKVSAVLTDPVTTADRLIRRKALPTAQTFPKLAEYALSARELPRKKRSGRVGKLSGREIIHLET